MANNSDDKFDQKGGTGNSDLGSEEIGLKFPEERSLKDIMESRKAEGTTSHSRVINLAKLIGEARKNIQDSSIKSESVKQEIEKARREGEDLDRQILEEEGRGREEIVEEVVSDISASAKFSSGKRFQPGVKSSTQTDQHYRPASGSGTTEHSMLRRIRTMASSELEESQGSRRGQSGMLRLPDGTILEAISMGESGPHRIRVDNLEYGPTSLEVIRDLIKRGLVSGNDEILHHGMWKRLGTQDLYLESMEIERPSGQERKSEFVFDSATSPKVSSFQDRRNETTTFLPDLQPKAPAASNAPAGGQPATPPGAPPFSPFSERTARVDAPFSAAKPKGNLPPISNKPFSRGRPVIPTKDVMPDAPESGAGFGNQPFPSADPIPSGLPFSSSKGHQSQHPTLAPLPYQTAQAADHMRMKFPVPEQQQEEGAEFLDLEEAYEVPAVSGSEAEYESTRIGGRPSLPNVNELRHTSGGDKAARYEESFSPELTRTHNYDEEEAARLSSQQEVAAQSEPRPLKGYEQALADAASSGEYDRMEGEASVVQDGDGTELADLFDPMPTEDEVSAPEETQRVVDSVEHLRPTQTHPSHVEAVSSTEVDREEVSESANQAPAQASPPPVASPPPTIPSVPVGPPPVSKTPPQRPPHLDSDRPTPMAATSMHTSSMDDVTKQSPIPLAHEEVQPYGGVDPYEPFEVSEKRSKWLYVGLAGVICLLLVAIVFVLAKGPGRSPEEVAQADNEAAPVATNAETVEPVGEVGESDSGQEVAAIDGSAAEEPAQEVALEEPVQEEVQRPSSGGINDLTRYESRLVLLAKGDPASLEKVAQALKEVKPLPPTVLAKNWGQFKRLGKDPIIYATKEPSGTSWEFIPDQEYGPTWRGDYAFYQLCGMIACGFDVPEARLAEINAQDFTALGGELSDVHQTSGKVKGILRRVEVGMTPLPIEVTSIWRGWLRNRTPLKSLKRSFSPSDDGGKDKAIKKKLVDANPQVIELARIFANVLTVDFLTNNFGRFAKHASAYGSHLQFKSNPFRVYAIGNEYAFQARNSTRVRGRFKWTDRYGRALIESIEKLDPEVVTPLLFPDASNAEKVVMNVFWGQRAALLEDVAREVKAGHEDVLF